VRDGKSFIADDDVGVRIPYCGVDKSPPSLDPVSPSWEPSGLASGRLVPFGLLGTQVPAPWAGPANAPRPAAAGAKRSTGASMHCTDIVDAYYRLLIKQLLISLS
jgi:hypothetical protein